MRSALVFVFFFAAACSAPVDGSEPVPTVPARTPTTTEDRPITSEKSPAPSSNAPPSAEMPGPSSTPAPTASCTPNKAVTGFASPVWRPSIAGVNVANAVDRPERITKPDCTIRFALVRLPDEDAAWSLLLHKTDTAAGSCNEPKGYVLLAAKSFAAPIVRFGSHVADPSLFVVAFGTKPSAAGVATHAMEQVDWRTGAVLHVASSYVKGKPQIFPPPSSSPASLSVQGCDVVLSGHGSFSGATGPKTDDWTAHYPSFLVDEAAPTTGAASATYD